MLIYHTVSHIMSMADCGDRVEAIMTAEEIQIEETDIEVVKDNDQPSKSNTSKKSSQTRRAFDGEFKLRVIKDFYQDGKNISRTARKFAVDRKQVHLWVQKEEKITFSRRADPKRMVRDVIQRIFMPEKGRTKSQKMVV